MSASMIHATCARLSRRFQIGLPAIGFSPINSTPVLVHGHDECLDAATYLRGIQIYKQIIADVSDVAA